VDRIYLAGEVEQEAERQRRQDIPLHPSTIASLQGAGKELGIEYDLQQDNIRDKKRRKEDRNDE